jgi:hypothetical protein
MWFFSGICAFATDHPDLRASSAGVRVILPDVEEAIREHLPEVVAHHSVMEFLKADLVSPGLATLESRLGVQGTGGLLVRVPLKGRIVEVGNPGDAVGLENLSKLANLSKVTSSARIADACLTDSPSLAGVAGGAKPVAARVDLFGGTLAPDPSGMTKASAFAPRGVSVRGTQCEHGEFVAVVRYAPPESVLRIREFGAPRDQSMEIRLKESAKVTISNDCNDQEDDRCKDQDPEHFSAFYGLLDDPPPFADRPLPFFGTTCSGVHDPEIREASSFHTSPFGSGCIPSKMHFGAD